MQQVLGLPIKPGTDACGKSIASAADIDHRWLLFGKQLHRAALLAANYPGSAHCQQNLRHAAAVQFGQSIGLTDFVAEQGLQFAIVEQQTLQAAQVGGQAIHLGFRDGQGEQDLALFARLAEKHCQAFLGEIQVNEHELRLFAPAFAGSKELGRQPFSQRHRSQCQQQLPLRVEQGGVAARGRVLCDQRTCGDQSDRGRRAE